METETQIDLTPFCGLWDSPSAVSEPFVKDGWRYATDSYVCVRTSATGESDTDLRDRMSFPPAENLFGAVKGDPEPWPIGAPWSDKLVLCPDCESGQIGVRECRECCGTGDKDCPHCNQPMTCKSCNGEGKIGAPVECETCKGTGKVPDGRFIGKHLIARRHEAAIRQLPGVRFWRSDDILKAMAFVFDGGEGRVMSRRQD